MRHIVDLESKLAVINWWKGNNLSSEKELRYAELYKKKERTQAEVHEMEELGKVEGDIEIRTGIIQIIDTKPIDVNTVNPVFEIAERQWRLINEFIEKLSEPYTGKKITIREAMNFLDKE